MKRRTKKKSQSQKKEWEYQKDIKLMKMITIKLKANYRNCNNTYMIRDWLKNIRKHKRMPKRNKSLFKKRI